MKRFFYTASLLSLLFFSIECCASTAFLGGAFSIGSGSDDTNYPLIYELSIGNASAFPITVSGTSPSEIGSVAIGSNGVAIFGGENFSTANPAFVYQLSANSTTATIAETPSDIIGIVMDVAIISNGTAILGGINGTTDSHLLPLVYSLAPNSNVVSSLSLPTGDDRGSISTVVARPDGTAILGGENGETSKPLIYKWENGSLSLVTNPDTDEGLISTAAVASDGTVLLGGLNTTTSSPLIYRMIGTSIEVISTPFGDTGQINSIAIDSDGNAVLGGASNSNVPLVYRLPSGASSVSSITVPVADGSINCVAIGPDNTAILGGEDDENNVALIYRLFSNSTTLIPIGNADLAEAVTCVGIDSSGTAILGGYTINDTPIVYSLAQNAGTASLINLPSNPNRPFGQIFCIAIYNSQGPYDFYRLAPLYNQGLQQARTKLRAAGL